MRKGQPHTEEAKLRISKATRGKPKSADTREKMAFARALYWAKKREEQQRIKDFMELSDNDSGTNIVTGEPEQL